MAATRNKDRHKHTLTLNSRLALQTKMNERLLEVAAATRLGVVGLVTHRGLAVDPQLKGFCEQAERAVPGLKVYPCGNMRGVNLPVTGVNAEYHPGYRALYATEAYGIFDGDPFVSITIGVRVTSSEYYVQSNAIENDKFAANTIEYRRVSTKDLKRAVVNFRKYFRKRTTFMNAVALYSDFRGAVTGYISGLAAGKAVALDALRSHYAFPNVISAVVAGDEINGSEFGDFMEKAKSYLDADRTVKEQALSGAGVVYVEIRNCGGMPTYDVFAISGTAAQANNVTLESLVNSGQHSSYTMRGNDELEAVFPGVLHKISVLMMMGNNEYVNQIGMRMDENIFWVMR